MELVCSIPYPITQQKLEYKLQSRIRDPYVRFNGRGEIIILPLPYYVRLAAHVSNGLKSRIRPVVGRIQPKARVSIVRWNLKEAGCEEYTNSRANLWSDEQKSHMRSCMWVRQQAMLKPNNYTESCMINEADGWRGRNVWYLGRSVRYALKEVTIA